VPSGGGQRNVVVQDLAGWANVQSDKRDYNRLWDGCYDVIVVLDGDRGRDWGWSEFHLSHEGKQLEGRLRAVGIPLRVLERYAPESYFSLRACEAVLGASLSTYFPLPIDRPVRPWWVWHGGENRGPLARVPLQISRSRSPGGFPVDLQRRRRRASRNARLFVRLRPEQEPSPPRPRR